MVPILAMHFSSVIPWLLIVWGIILRLKPNIFVTPFWKRYDRAQRRLSPEAYLTFARRAAEATIIVGVVLLISQ